MKLIIFCLTTITFLAQSFALRCNEIDYNISNDYNKVFNTKILSDEDTILYQQIFILQKDCKFKKADKKIFKIKNTILMGHVLAQRYLHPDCYRSQFLELSSWMKLYNDMPQAKRIYRLAIRRMPEGYKRPPAPINSIGIKENLKKVDNNSKKYQSTISLNKNQRKEKYQLLINIKSRVNKGWPTGALKLLNQQNTKKILDKVEINQQKELIAKGYLLANKDDLAIKYALEALQSTPEEVPFANWTAGIAAWKIKDFQLASKFFSNFSLALKDDPWHQSSGAFWAARSYGELKNYKEVNFWLKISSNNIETFYGQLSNNILGTNKSIDWSHEKIDSKDEKIFLNIPAGKRIMALIQIGRVIEAEDEIIKINKILNESVAYASLGIARHFNLAETQLKIAYKLSSTGKKIPLKYFYPIPNWVPKNGFYVNKSLIFSFMHQESTFNKDAKSRKGAMGLMQIMPRTAKFISKNKKVKRGNKNVLLDPLINIEVGQEYINYLLKLDIVNNNLIYMAAAYNGGPGNLQKWLKETYHNNDPLLFMEGIPSRETRWFMEKILTNYWIYQNQFDQHSLSLIELAKGNDPVYSF